MVYLGIDYGRKRTGIAVRLEGLVLPLDPVAGGQTDVICRIGELRDSHGSITVVIGLPLSAAGKPTELSAEVEVFAERLRDLGHTVALVKEAGTTAEAFMQRGKTDRKGRIDSLAACEILKRYLNIP
jgi:putative holliday junction resolvase